MKRVQTNGRPIEILLVEDSAGDVRLTQESLKESKVRNKLTVVPDGVEAMAYLKGQNGYSDAPRPDLILLDLNLPKMDGRQVLAEIKSDPVLMRIPVVVSRHRHRRTISRARTAVTRIATSRGLSIWINFFG